MTFSHEMAWALDDNCVFATVLTCAKLRTGRFKQYNRIGVIDGEVWDQDVHR